jgi:membrane protease YdiL (CAAX protease family)
MQTKQPGEPGSGQPLPTTLVPTPITNWLIGPNGLRAGWRLLMYFAIVLLFSVVASFVARSFAKPTYGFPSPLALLMQDVIGFAVVFGAALVISRIEHRPVGEYGLPARNFLGAKFRLGFLFGLVEISMLMGLIAAFGGFSFGPFALQGADIACWGAFHFLLFLFVGLFEEFLFRGYTQFTLGDGIGFWPAAILLSLGFGAVHLGNPGEGIVGAASVALVGLFFCFCLRRTGNLWYAVGLHASFDWGETFLFSVPNSGVVIQGHLSNSALHGPHWLTGGSIGPEGSVFCFVTMGLQFLVVALLFPAKKESAGGSTFDAD